MQNWAVFTGDIVRSTDLGADALQDVFTALEIAAQAIAQWPDSTTTFARFRGDGWQIGGRTHLVVPQLMGKAGHALNGMLAV